MLPSDKTKLDSVDDSISIHRTEINVLKVKPEADPLFSAHPVSNITNGTGFLKNNNGSWTYDNNSYELSFAKKLSL